MASAAMSKLSIEQISAVERSPIAGAAARLRGGGFNRGALGGGRRRRHALAEHDEVQQRLGFARAAA